MPFSSPFLASMLVCVNVCVDVCLLEDDFTALVLWVEFLDLGLVFKGEYHLFSSNYCFLLELALEKFHFKFPLQKCVFFRDFPFCFPRVRVETSTNSNYALHGLFWRGTLQIGFPLSPRLKFEIYDKGWCSFTIVP